MEAEIIEEKLSNLSFEKNEENPKRGKNRSYPNKKVEISFSKQLESSCLAFGNINKTQIISFVGIDPCNPQNKVSSMLCKEDGSFVGSLFITQVNSVEVKPQIIYGTPKILSPYIKNQSFEDEDQREFIKFPTCNTYYLSNKWNGSNVLFYKYENEKGEYFISAKPRMSAFISDGLTGNFFSAIKEMLNLPLSIESNELPVAFHPLKDKNVQSIAFELCGYKVPHLVKYDFDLALKPLFTIQNDGRIMPILNSETIQKLDNFISQEDLVKELTKVQNEDLEANKKYRNEKNLNAIYWYNHFIVEGKVLYCVQEDGFLVNREAMYKIKPKDIELFHWEQFDNNVQTKILISLEQLFNKSIELTEENLKQELDMTDFQWIRWKKDIMDLLAGIVHPKKRSDQLPQVLIMVGLPGSGKSTMANELVKLGWERVNQDEMGTRKVCEQRMEQSLRRGKSVVVDRCNFDVSQRKTWFKIASKFGVTNINALIFDISPDICKSRISVRKNHPTIAEGSAEGPAIIDRFKKIFFAPNICEGFRNIYVIKDSNETTEMIKKFSL